MTVGSLFSGIGGLDLGLERAGHTVRWQVEANPYCQRILAKHWPHVPCYPDVTQLTGTELAPVDLICGGFPCQPVSHAGLQKGTDDDRWLWPHFARLLGVLRPRYALLENVPGLLTANGGHAFGAILADLADSGYDAEWDHLPASAFGAPHRRYRAFIVASLPDAERHRAGVQSRHAPSGGQAWEPPHASKPTLVRPEDWKADAERLAPSRQDVADADRLRPYSTENNDGARTPQSHLAGRSRWVQSERCVSPCQEGQAVADANSASGRSKGATGETVPQPGTVQRSGRRSGRGGEGDVADAEVNRCRPGRSRGSATERPGEPEYALQAVADADDQSQSGGSLYAGAGASLSEFASSHQWWESEPDVGRVAHGVPQRVDRLKALGNAVVPQVAEWLGRRLQERR